MLYILHEPFLRLTLMGIVIASSSAKRSAFGTKGTQTAWPQRTEIGLKCYEAAHVSRLNYAFRACMALSFLPSFLLSLHSLIPLPS